MRRCAFLKNQIRQRQPVSVALEAAPDAAVNEFLDRGVLPELFTTLESDAPALEPAIRDRVLHTLAPLAPLLLDFHGSHSAVEGNCQCCC